MDSDFFSFLLFSSSINSQKINDVFSVSEPDPLRISTLVRSIRWNLSFHFSRASIFRAARQFLQSTSRELKSSRFPKFNVSILFWSWSFAISSRTFLEKLTDAIIRILLFVLVARAYAISFSSVHIVSLFPKTRGVTRLFGKNQ